VSFQVFDGHGGSDAAAYMKRHAMRFLFEDGEFPQASHVDEVFLQSVENTVHRTFLQADLALADNMDISLIGNHSPHCISVWEVSVQW
jgi:protein phosphatase PTC2/3